MLRGAGQRALAYLSRSPLRIPTGRYSIRLAFDHNVMGNPSNFGYNIERSVNFQAEQVDIESSDQTTEGETIQHQFSIVTSCVRPMLTERS